MLNGRRCCWCNSGIPCWVVLHSCASERSEPASSGEAHFDQQFIQTLQSDDPRAILALAVGLGQLGQDALTNAVTVSAILAALIAAVAATASAVATTPAQALFPGRVRVRYNTQTFTGTLLRWEYSGGRWFGFVQPARRSGNPAQWWPAAAVRRGPSSPLATVMTWPALRLRRHISPI